MIPILLLRLVALAALPDSSGLIRRIANELPTLKLFITEGFTTGILEDWNHQSYSFRFCT